MKATARYNYVLTGWKNPLARETISSKPIFLINVVCLFQALAKELMAPLYLIEIDIPVEMTIFSHTRKTYLMKTFLTIRTLGHLDWRIISL
jgi:hypothetical protein